MPAKNATQKKPKALLVCSPGGHLLQLYSLQEPVWSHFDRVWVTLAKIDTKSVLAAEKVHWAFGPTNRNLKNLLRNAVLSLKILYLERPSCVISTGAGIAVPFLVLGRLFGARTIYIESFARRRNLSLTGKLIYYLVHDFVVQCPELHARKPGTLYFGTIY